MKHSFHENNVEFANEFIFVQRASTNLVNKIDHDPHLSLAMLTSTGKVHGTPVGRRI